MTMLAWILALLSWFALTIPSGGEVVAPPDQLEPARPISVSPPSDGIVSPPSPGYAPPIDSRDGHALVLAPIEDLSLVIRETYPPQYVLQVTFAPSNGRVLGFTAQ
jgi:hypothetical protein